MKNINKKLKINDTLKSILIYTGIFIIISLVIVSIFDKYNKSFIFTTDGARQHIITLRYFRSLLVELIRTGSISGFTWAINNGMDLFSNFAYYIIGDIFSYISIFFPTKSVESLYSILVIVRMYFIGISFLYFCKYKKMNNISSILGALMYTFCTFVLFGSIRHPYFTNAIILFPLLMVGIEKIIKEEKVIFYTLIVAIMYLLNFYFAYMLSLIIAIYGIVLAIHTYKKEGLNKIIKILIKTLIFSIIGVMISAVVLLPTGIDFINSERIATNIVYSYNIFHYRYFVNNLIAVNEHGYWVYIGVQSLILLSLPWFIRNRKENYPLFITMLILFIPLLISQVGSIFCGFGYPNNRWSFVIAFIFSFITVHFINSNPKMDKKLLQDIFLSLLIFLGVNVILHVDIKYYELIQLFIAILFIIIISNKEKINSISKKVNLYNVVLLVTLTFGIITTANYFYDINGEKYVTQFLDKKGAAKSINTSHGTIEDFDKAINYIKNNDNTFYKISKYPYSQENVSLIKDFNSMGHYYSLTPKIYGELNTDLNNSQYYLSVGSKEFDYRTKITALLGVKYYIRNSSIDQVPYGYIKDTNYQGTSSIYVNNYALPFGLLYTKHITLDEFNKLSSLEKESSLLNAVALDKDTLKKSNTSQAKENTFKGNIKEINYQIVDNNILKNNKLEISNINNNKLKLKIENIKNSELYIKIDNLNFDPTIQSMLQNSQEISPVSKEIQKNKSRWTQPNYAFNTTVEFRGTVKTRSMTDKFTSPYYMDVKKLLFNLGYYDETKGEITLSFNKNGTYTFDDIKIYAVSMDNYEKNINSLRKSNFQVIEYNNGYLKGKTNAETNGVLQFSTMYNKGFKVFVDGKEVNTFVSNKYFLGINIEKGKHEIELKYKNPYIKTGLIISLTGICILISYSIVNKRKNQISNVKKYK